MSDVDQINALAQLIRCVDGNHTMGAGALAESILEFRTEWDTPRIIRTVEELQDLDPDTVVQPSLTEHREWPHVISAASLRWELKAWGTDKGLPAVVIRDGAEVRATQKSLEEETDND